MEPSRSEEITQLQSAIAALEAQRTLLGDAVVDAALAPLRARLAGLPTAALAPGLAGQRRLVTILFADIAGFTALAETMDPEAVRDLMNTCFERLVPIIEKYGGTVDKFTGDGIMVLFGAPVAHENDAERALRTALEMRDALAAFNADRGTDLGLHFGVNTGLVIAGGIGTRGQQAYSVMGDAVNVAARLEEVAARDEVLVGPDTHRLTAPLFEFAGLEPVAVKGKAEPVPAYRLLGIKAIPGPTRGLAGLAAPLVGRAAELEALQSALERLSAGQGGIVTLGGEAGLGKSRLIAETRKWANGQMGKWAADLQWLEGRCLSYGVSIAYLLWLDVLRGLLQMTLDAPPAAVRDALREWVARLGPDREAEVYPYLGRLLALPLEPAAQAVVRDIEGEHLKAGVFRAVAALLESAARQRPLVVVCEDLHWADPTSIELLEYLLPITERAPLLFICVLRPEREHPCWRLRETVAPQYRHTDIWLDPLSTAESAALVGYLVRVEDLPPALHTRILDHAEGNPFFVEEIIRALIDSGAIARDAATGRWRATRDVADIAIPDTLHGVLMARIDRLQEETRRVLQLASVIGRIFLRRILAAIAQEERTLDDHLQTLQQQEMIRERVGAPELEYIFKHQLTQEAAYDGLLKRDRRIFHRRVAEALERLFPERIAELVGLLAYHWERADEPAKATEYLLRAGDQARLAYAHQEAADYYQRALTFLREQGDAGRELAARTLMKLGLTYHTAFDFPRARQAYEEGFALWRRAADLTCPLAPHSFRVPWGNPLTLDPTVAEEGYSRAVIEQLFSGLAAEGPELDVTPDVAQSWEVLAGGREYVFHLRDDVYWSDGAPVTASDFEYAWKRLLAPAFSPANAPLLFDVKDARAFHQGDLADPDRVGVRALDPVTLVVELEEPTSYFPSLLTCPVTYPIPRHCVETYGAAWAEAAHLVTNGPFYLAGWSPGQWMAAQRNPRYHGRCSGNVQRVELLLLGDYYGSLELYEADQLDAMRIAAPEKDRAWHRHAEEYISAPTLRTDYVAFHVQRPPFDDARVRRAFALVIDRDALAGQVLGGYAFPAAGGFVPPGMPGHVPGAYLPYDPPQARQLLAEAGYPGGVGFPRVEALSGRLSWQDTARYLQEQWREHLSVEVQWEVLEISAFLDRQARSAPHITLNGWTADYPDPDNFLRACPVRQDIQWRHPAYEALVDEARRITDQRARVGLYEQAERILTAEAVLIPLTYGRVHLLVKPWVSRYPTSAIKTWFWKDIVIEPHERKAEGGRMKDEG